MPSRTKRLLPTAAAIAWAVACQDNLAQLCPPNSTPSGNFNLTLDAQVSPNQCKVVRTADGGPADADVAANPGVQLATICEGPDDAGNPTVYLAVPDRGVRGSPLGPDASFSFSSTAPKVSQTACACEVDIHETINGNLVPAGDGGIQVQPDGGLSGIAGITGTLVDQVSSSSSADAGCLCNVPCDLQYHLTGTKQQ
jgi:hypothetical protein